MRRRRLGDREQPRLEVMLDGFPIIRPWENRAMLTTADLDQRHGKVSRIMLDGASVTTYH